MKSKAFTIKYGDRTVLDVPEMEFEKGRIYAVMGANGSGKTTFAKALANGGLYDKDVRTGYMPQKNFAYRMSVLKNALVTGADEKRVLGYLSRLGMENLLRENAKNLSGGETAKLAIARILGASFDLLILDEPTAAMDVESTFESEKLIKEYCGNENAAVVIITHSSGQAYRMADELIFLYKGKVLERGNARNVIDDPSNEETKKFLSL